ncbi:uncharacterized protein LOC128205296 [Mya arenaria]|uniref:uncharacterized protein LOC128205296 n=1 Tax=Mya arenaria TaxID=6604 RepID=UPI0022E0F20C|nr:uncharacterized protein LOC128205296 [Mya arenaria]
MEVNFLCVFLNIGIILLFYLNVICTENAVVEVEQRYADKQFPKGLKIHNKTITCSEDHEPGQFPAHTWTCRDMRVDGLRMAYGYNPVIIKSDDKCRETDGRNELSEVCRRMMAQIGSNKQLWAAFVTNATCGRINEKRFLLNMTGPDQYSWNQMKPGYGWIYTLRCMAVR